MTPFSNRAWICSTGTPSRFAVSASSSAIRSVEMRPGWIAFTRIPSVASSVESVLRSPCTAARSPFESISVPYAGEPG